MGWWCEVPLVLQTIVRSVDVQLGQILRYTPEACQRYVERKVPKLASGVGFGTLRSTYRSQPQTGMPVSRAASG